MPKYRYLFLVFVFLLTQCGGTGNEASPTASVPLPENDAAEVTVSGAGSTSQAATAATPTLSFLTKNDASTESISLYVIDNCTFDSSTGSWSCQSSDDDVSITLKFYKASDGTLITVDITDVANYFPGGDLFGITPPGSADTGIQIEVLVDVEKTLRNDTVLSFAMTTGRRLATSDNTSSDAVFSHTGTGSISGTFSPQTIDSTETKSVSLTLSSVSFTASGLGSEVSGSYTFSGTIGDDTFQGTASFDQDGCSGATIQNEDGTTLGTAEINEDGELVFTDSENNETIFERVDVS